MLPGMKAKPLVAVVGAGNLASALAVALRRAGFTIEVVIARSRGKSLNQARRLARQVGAQALVSPADVKAELVWFCVPDSEIAAAARLLAGKFSWKGRVAFHSSGALTSDELGVLRKRDATVASVHPLMTFVRGSRPPFAGVPFAIEGGPSAVRMARNIVSQLGGLSYAMRKPEKAAYHAWATFTSPLLTALLATAQEVAAIAGVKRTTAARRMIPILLQTLANYAAFGGSAGFSGPIVRGDVDTIRRHLAVLRAVPPAREVYLALARAALQYLPAKNKNSLKRLLAAQG
jgi:predicted short-subunit dehydrogenase-like oxidoreductase (DUF2520 family)